MEPSCEELRLRAQRSVGDNGPGHEKQVGVTVGKCLERGLGGSQKPGPGSSPDDELVPLSSQVTLDESLSISEPVSPSKTHIL